MIRMLVGSNQMNGLEILREESAKIKEKKGELDDYLEHLQTSHKTVPLERALAIAFSVALDPTTQVLTFCQYHMAVGQCNLDIHLG